MKQSRVSFLSKVFTLIISVLLIFAITEVFFRIFRPRKPTASVGKPDPIFHHIFPPYYIEKDEGIDFSLTYTTNSEGFRDKDYTVEKSSDVYRIAVLGDSFTFGSGVNDGQTFPDYLEEILNNSFKDKEYEVLNCGIGSYSPILEYILLKNKIIRYSPDLVMLFYDFSDLQEDILYARRAIYDSNGEIIGCNPLYINGHLDYINILRNYSYFFSFTYNKFWSFTRKIRLLGLKDYLLCKLKGERTKVAIRKRKDLRNIEFDRYMILREDKDKEVIQYYWKNSKNWLNKIKAYLDERQIEFILVAYPYGLQVSPTAWNKGRLLWQFEPNKLYDSKLPFEMFYEYSKKYNVKFINLRHYLLNYADEDLYFDHDGHWTSLGNKRVAEGIFNSEVFISSVRKI